MSGTSTPRSSPPTRQGRKLQELKRRVTEEWLPVKIADCASDPRRPHRHLAEDCSLDGVVLTEREAASILRAFRERLFTPEMGVRLPLGRGKSGFFEHGPRPKADDPQPQKLKPFREGFVDIAAAADLHFRYHWPVKQLGFEPHRWEVDLVVQRENTVLIAGEAKSSSMELDALLEGVAACGLLGAHAREQKTLDPVRHNAHPKYEYLNRLKRADPPVYFWAVSPGDRRASKVVFGARGRLALVPVKDIPGAGAG